MNRSLSVSTYLVDHFCFSSLSLLGFLFYMFRLIPGWTFRWSWIALVVCVLGCNLTGILLTYDIARERNRWNLLYNVSFGFGIYSMVAYFDFYSKQILIAGAVAGVLTLIGWACIFLRKINRDKQKDVIIKRRLYNGVGIFRRNFGMAMFVVMFMIVFRLASSGTLVDADVAATSAYGDQHSLANNMETILLLQQDEWEKLSLSERLNVAQVVANVEGRYWGLSNEINVGTADLDPLTFGYYSHTTHQVVIDSTHLEKDSARSVLETICHECYHAYSHQLCEMYSSLDGKHKALRLLEKPAVYTQEFENYIAGEDDLEGYLGQNCENDAYLYAEVAVEGYYIRIEEYLQGSGAQESGMQENSDIVAE